MRKRRLLRALASIRRLPGCRDADSRWRAWTTIGCGVAGFLCNLAPYEVRHGIHMFFGGSAAILAALLMGPWYGGLAAVLTYLSPLLVAGHPLWLIVGVVEAVVIGAVTRKQSKATSAEVLFWVVLGTTVLATSGMQLVERQAIDHWVVLLKTPMNSLMNLSLAVGGMMLIRQWRKPRRARKDPLEGTGALRSIRTNLFVMTILAALAPLTVLFIEQGKRLERDRHSEERLLQDAATRQAAAEVALQLHSYRQVILSVAGELEGLADSSHANKIAAVLERCRAIHREFLTMLVSDAEGRIIGVSPMFNVQGQRLTARDSVADRDYFRVPRDTGMPYLSGGFLGRGFGSDRIAAISAPIQRERHFHGVVEGSISLDRFTLPAKTAERDRFLTLVLLDAAGTVLSATPGSGFSPLDRVEQHPQLRGLLQALTKGPSTFETGSYLVSSHEVAGTGWTLVGRRPLDSITAEMESYYRLTGLGMAAATIACLLLIRLLAAAITRPIDQILDHVRRFSLDAPAPVNIELSRLAPRELEELAGDFSRMSAGLAASYSDLTDSLEERLRLNQELTRMVAQIKHKAAELEEAKSKSDDAIRVKSAFLTNISHEVRTPLNGLLGMLSILLEGPLEDEQRRKAAIAQESAMSLMGLVSDLLNFSSLAGGTTEVESIEFYPSAIVDAVVSLSQRQATEKDLKLLSYVDPKAKRKFKGDPGKLRQALSHLVNNAVKFTSRGSVRVAVTCKIDREGYMSFRFEVSDTGIGIPKEQLDRIFEPFTQADGSLTRRHGGAGLGLALVKQIVDRLAGRIEVKSEAGIGSVFTIMVELPAASTATFSEPLPQSQLETSAERCKRILVVEDNAVNQKVVCRVLQKAGYRVVVASDGQQALLEMEREGPFEVILMDCQMPVMDGYEATAEIRRREGNGRRTPIVATTAHAMEGDRERCLNAGMDDYITKPIDRDRLLAMMVRFTTQPVG